MEKLIINYGIMVLAKADDTPNQYGCAHFVGFENPPAHEEYIHLYEELKNDPESGLADREFLLVPAPQNLVDQMRKEIEEESGDLTVTYHGE